MIKYKSEEIKILIDSFLLRQIDEDNKRFLGMIDEFSNGYCERDEDGNERVAPEWYVIQELRNKVNKK